MEPDNEWGSDSPTYSVEIATGNPQVFFHYPYLHPLKLLPLVRVWVFGSWGYRYPGYGRCDIRLTYTTHDLHEQLANAIQAYTKKLHSVFTYSSKSLGGGAFHKRRARHPIPIPHFCPRAGPICLRVPRPRPIPRIVLLLKLPSTSVPLPNLHSRILVISVP